jgi:class 3 adenylate cyclase
MICPACQKANPSDARYCLACGAPLASESSPANRSPDAASARDERGNAKGAPSALEGDAPRLEGERRLVTVLFADVSGFTALSEQMDAEEVCRLLNGCFDVLVPIAERYGGEVDKFIGDEVMVLFGAPAAHEDDPVRALHAAVDMMRAIVEFNVQHGTALGIHIGVNTGLVVAGQIGSRGRRQYTVIGDAVNLAARLQEAAPQGQILVGPDTYRRSAPLFDFAAPSALPIRGKAETVAAYRLLGRKAQPGSVRGLAGLRSPMVGRGAELEALLKWTEAARAGRGGAVLITGEAGLGKSRLVAEWQAACAGNVAKWAQGHCLSYGQSLPYHLLVDLLRALIGVPAVAGEAETRAALRNLVRTLWGSARDVYTYLGHLLSIRLEGEDLARVRALDPQAMQAQYLAGLRQVLRALAAGGPVVLISEDIHWADPSSAELLGRLLPVALDLPVLFCFVTRPEPSAPGWKLIATAREVLGNRVAELPLRTLGETDGRQLISNLLQVEAIPESVRALVLQRAEGNPFFVEEVIRTLIESGVIAHEDGHWVARQEITAIEIPDNLQALLMARIDRLPAEVRNVLRVAAVIGRQFPVRVLERVLQG